MKQSKRANELQERAEKMDIAWYGWDSDVNQWRLEGFLGRTLKDVDDWLFSQFAPTVGEGEATVTTVGDDPNPHRSLIKDTYVLSDIFLAEIGDVVKIDAGSENEIVGHVIGTIGDSVQVQSTQVKLHGRPRPDLIGIVYSPAQNGIKTPWGVTDALTKA